MLVIVGLGNPGERYETTRHNIGFRILDQLAIQTNLTWETDKYLEAEIAKDNEYMLFKPNTYVNESGRSLHSLHDRERLDFNQLWIVHDDTEIPFGKVRVKQGGTSGGHNGIKSIDEAIGEEYYRIRVGVGRPESHQADLAEYVLQSFSDHQEGDVLVIIDQLVEFLVKSIEDRQLTATTFNCLKEKK